jgi:hypothetical protein
MRHRVFNMLNYVERANRVEGISAQINRLPLAHQDRYSELTRHPLRQSRRMLDCSDRKTAAFQEKQDVSCAWPNLDDAGRTRQEAEQKPLPDSQYFSSLCPCVTAQKRGIQTEILILRNLKRVG